MARTTDLSTLNDRMTPSKGGWSLRVMINGRREPFWAPTKTELKDKVKKAIEAGHDQRRGIVTDHEAPRTYAELCGMRLAVHKQRASSKATFEANLGASMRKFGCLRLDQIRRHAIEVWVVELLELGLAGVTICNYLKDMERVLEYARDNGWLIGPNPVKNVDRPPLKFEPDPFESWEDVFDIARAFAINEFAVGSWITRFAAGLGLRPQEVLCGRECDLDRAAGTFFVQRTWDDTLRTEVELTKTSASCANLNLTSLAAEVVREIPPGIHRDPLDWRHSPLLFARPDGSRITPDYFRDRWAETLATLPHITYRPPKRLRDTFATLTLLELGLDQVKTVATLMRHTSEKVTLQHYARIVQDLRLRAAIDASRGMPRFAVN